MSKQEMIPLAMAAQRLRLSWGQAWSRVLSGILDGKQNERGRWYVTVESVRRLEQGEPDGPIAA